MAATGDIPYSDPAGTAPYILPIQSTSSAIKETTQIDYFLGNVLRVCGHVDGRVLDDRGYAPCRHRDVCYFLPYISLNASPNYELMTQLCHR